MCVVAVCGTGGRAEWIFPVLLCEAAREPRDPRVKLISAAGFGLKVIWGSDIHKAVLYLSGGGWTGV